MESYTLCEVLVVRLNGECPVKYGVRMNSEARYLELKEQLRDLCGISPERLLLAEVAYCQIRALLGDEARVNPNSATELYAYELPDVNKVLEVDNAEAETEPELVMPESPPGQKPRGLRKLKPSTANSDFQNNRARQEPRLSRPIPFKRSSVSISSHHSSTASVSSEGSQKWPSYLIAVNRKCVRQETYFLSQQKSKPSLFGLPLLLGCNRNSTCQSLYQAVWGQVTRLLSPLPQGDQTNHATDCDDSLGYAFPFTLKAVLQGGQICALCHWTQFCRGCVLPCSDDYLVDKCKNNQGTMYIAIDWDPTALHLRYQSSREKLWLEHESVATCRKLHTEPIDLDYCLKAFTSEERLETKYHCSNCQDKQPATKKLQIWRLPPILVKKQLHSCFLFLDPNLFQIIHLKRFDCVNNKWVKTQKVVNFPFKDFDPTFYLASVPQETILRHRQLQQEKPGAGRAGEVDGQPAGEDP
ncbi:hypothetical protein NQ318_005798 [Aromia moschata]|uniref:ubiquitinyl hydrolase 1 n=1 Tax=Aromia moschata TaxID=1265417 RepID=A0AAV8YQJ8_9CUCU|nr:hypothetical protein NQ318_005798 [Aromia moschata]